MAAEAGLLGFWRWAYGDLRGNGVRGVLAEYLVGQALGVDMSTGRTEWAAWDLLTPEGVKVEVKTGAYIQSWTAPAKAYPVRYSGLLARSWVEGTAGSYTDTAEVRSDVYVFALQTCRDPDQYDALDLSQWEFRVLPGPVVQGWGQKSVGLPRLIALGTTAVGAHELRDAVAHAAARKTTAPTG